MQVSYRWGRPLIRTTFLAAFAAASTATAVAQATASVSVNPNGTTKGIGASYLGFSLDLAETSGMMGYQTTINPIFTKLVKNLTPYANGPIQIRELSDEAYTTNT